VPKLNWRWLILIVLILLGILGWFSSPVSQEGRPTLLLPEVKKVVIYRHQAARWIRQLSALDGQIDVLLSGNRMDPLSLSRKAQGVYADWIKLFQAVDATIVPQALAGVHQTIKEVIQAYLDATQKLLAWVSDPNELTLGTTLESLESAGLLLTALETNAWMQGTGFAGSR